MKDLTTFLNKSLVNEVSVEFATRAYNVFKPESKEELKELIYRLIEERGNNADLNDIDTSAITDMSYMFYMNKDFNGDISKWDVSKVKNMTNMFKNSPLEKNPPKWYKE